MHVAHAIADTLLPSTVRSRLPNYNVMVQMQLIVGCAVLEPALHNLTPNNGHCPCLAPEVVIIRMSV